MRCAIFGPKMTHLSWTILFLKQTILLSSTYWPFSLCKIFKKFFQRIQSYEDAQCLSPKWPICPNENFFRKPVNEPCFFHSCLSKSKKLKPDITISEIMTIKEYWNLIVWEPFLAITWEPDFSEACSFRRMLMNHRNFHFTQIPEKWGFFPKNLALSHTTI